MTLQELYSAMGESYEQAIRVLRVEKLVDKHIRKLPRNGLFESLLEAGQAMDPEWLFEAAHAAKGNCGNLGLIRLGAAVSEIAEEFRPGNPRRMTDAEVTARLKEIAELYSQASEAIRRYEAENP
jgi:HPt (histidine-containing phosphotransfer) domain-containing protein